MQMHRNRGTYYVLCFNLCTRQKWLPPQIGMIDKIVVTRSQYIQNMDSLFY